MTDKKPELRPNKPLLRRKNRKEKHNWKQGERLGVFWSLAPNERQINWEPLGAPSGTMSWKHRHKEAESGAGREKIQRRETYLEGEKVTPMDAPHGKSNLKLKPTYNDFLVWNEISRVLTVSSTAYISRLCSMEADFQSETYSGKLRARKIQMKLVQSGHSGNSLLFRSKDSVTGTMSGMTPITNLPPWEDPASTHLIKCVSPLVLVTALHDWRKPTSYLETDLRNGQEQQVKTVFASQSQRLWFKNAGTQGSSVPASHSHPQLHCVW